LVRRLKAYADGSPDDFSDVPIDFGPVSGFRRRVLEECRRVGYGATISYGDLAVRAGASGAARAVGNCMASNRIPLMVPCHRVVCSDGRLGAYSAPGGVKTKRRLLEMESARAGFMTGS
jgi:methylated-DNA-[protein]-cysteine S-methyltransferase